MIKILHKMQAKNISFSQTMLVLKHTAVFVRDVLLSFLLLSITTSLFFWVFISVDIVVFGHIADYQKDIGVSGYYQAVLLFVPIVVSLNTVFLIISFPFVKLLPIYKHRWMLVIISILNVLNVVVPTIIERKFNLTGTHIDSIFFVSLFLSNILLILFYYYIIPTKVSDHEK